MLWGTENYPRPLKCISKTCPLFTLLMTSFHQMLQTLMSPSPVILPHLKRSPSSPLPNQVFPAFQDPATSDWLVTQKSPRTGTRRQDAGVMHKATTGPLKAAVWEYFQAARTPSQRHRSCNRRRVGHPGARGSTRVLSDLLFSSSAQVCARASISKVVMVRRSRRHSVVVCTGCPRHTASALAAFLMDADGHSQPPKAIAEQLWLLVYFDVELEPAPPVGLALPSRLRTLHVPK